MDLQQPTSDVDSEGESDRLSNQVSDSFDEDRGHYWRPREKYWSAPEVTLSSLTEAHREESTVPVLKQRSYTGKGAIPSALANTLCTDLGVDGMLEKLNTTLDTLHTLDSVGQVLETYVAKNCDFGTAYAYLRRYWNDIRTITYLPTYKEEDSWDREMRQNVLVDGWITKRDVPPRRVWDLYANRVVPYWVAREKPYGISHAWVDGKDRVDVTTPINQREWPVPMPKDANLDLIRIEMLNVMLEESWECTGGYMWLDVLCLRQEGGKGEHLRLEEWKLDVPTIGAVYCAKGVSVVCYFSGLGRPLHLTSDYFESDRCWFRRAWTLQEGRQFLIIGGETDNDVVEDDIRKRFNKQLTPIEIQVGIGTIVDILSKMQTRVSTKPLDKIAGLVYVLRTDPIPIYDAEQSVADAWETLMDVMSSWHRSQLLFFYFEPGNGSKYWRPSWEQVTTNTVMAPCPLYYPGQVDRTKDPDADYFEGYLVKSGNVQGLGEVPMEPKLRQGELDFKDTTGAPHTLQIVADHTYPIPDGSYTLIGCDGWLSTSDLWVVGKMREDGKFKKLSVFRSEDGEQGKLRKLGFESVNIFLC